MSLPDLAVPIRDVIVANSIITSRLTAYKGSFPVFTRRPVPLDVTFPVIVIGPDVSQNNTADGINDFRPLVIRDVIVYGGNDSAESYRGTEILAYALRTLFHRQRTIIVPNWNVLLVNVNGPQPAPTDDDSLTARMVTLNIQLAKSGING